MICGLGFIIWDDRSETITSENNDLLPVTKPSPKISSKPVVKETRDGDKRVQTTYVNDVKHGKETVYVIDDKGVEIKDSETMYVNGKKSGKDVEYWTNGNVSSEWIYKNGLLDGIVRTYYESGEFKRLNSYKNGKADGDHKNHNKEGELISLSKFVNGMRLSRIIWQRKLDISINWEYYNGIKIERPIFKSNLINGSYVRENKTVNTTISFSFNVKEGLVSGKHTVKYNNYPNTLNKLMIKDGLITGEILSYSFERDDKQNIKKLYKSKVYKYSNGNCVYMKTMKSTGQIHREYTYSKGIPTQYKRYHTNGELKYLTNYSNGLFHGECIQNSTNGSSVFIYEQGLCQSMTHFYKNKNIALKLVFKTKNKKRLDANNAVNYSVAYLSMYWGNGIDNFIDHLNKQNKLLENQLIEGKFKSGTKQFEIPIVDDRVHGVVRTYHESTKKIHKVKSYDNGKLKGSEKIFSNDGMLQQELDHYGDGTFKKVYDIQWKK